MLRGNFSQNFIEIGVYINMKPKTSPIWKYFVTKNDYMAICTICLKEYSRKGRTTTALKSHLKSMHPEQFQEFEMLDAGLKEKQEEKKEQEQFCLLVEEAKKQLTVQQNLTRKEFKDTSEQKFKEIDCLIAEMIILQDLPFHFVEGLGFRRVINCAIPQYRLRGCEFFTKLVYDDVYNQALIKIKQLLKEFEKITFTNDFRPELNSGISLLSVTAHGVTKDFRKVTIVLKCDVMEGRHKGQAISVKFQSFFEEWGIRQNAVHCIVRDRGSNIIKAMQLTDIQDFNCTIHQIQRCIKIVAQSEEWLQQLIAKLKGIATHFAQSLIAQKKLQQIQTERLNQPAVSAIQDSPNRWNSTFYMMERFLKIKDSLTLYLSTEKISTITADDWLYVEKYVKILKPFEEITKEFSSSHVTISSVIPLIQVITGTLQAEESKPDSSDQFKRVIKKTVDELNSRFSDITKNFVCTLATYLDPRYKTKFFNEITKREVETELIRLMTTNEEEEIVVKNEFDPSNPKKRKINESIHENLPSTSTTVFQQETEHSLKILESILNTNDSEEEDTSDHFDLFAMAKKVLHDYNKEKRLPLKEDPLKWWHTNSNKYMLLLPLVRRFLSAPSSSIASEQLLNGAALICGEKQNKLSGEMAAKLLFLKCNLPLLNSEY